MGEEVGGPEREASVEKESQGEQRRSWFHTASSVITVLAAIFAVYAYLSTREEKVPCYAVEGTSLVANTRKGVDGISILYRGKEVPELTSTTVWLWNAGSRTIDEADIAPSDPLRIVGPPGVLVLASKVVKYHRATVAPRLRNDGRVVFPMFDFLDKDDGFVVQILHTGNPDVSGWKMLGTVKGSQPVRRVVATRIEDVKGWAALLPGIALLVAALVLIKYVEKIVVSVERLVRRDPWSSLTQLLVLVAVFAAVFVFTITCGAYVVERTACTLLPQMLR